MSRLNLRQWSIAPAARLYALMLIVYPSTFRREYGREMVGVFRVACRYHALSGWQELIRFWFDAFADLLTSGPAERLSSMRRRSESHRPQVYIAALVLSLLAGYFHLRADADALSVALILGGAFVFGLIRPEAAWKFAVIMGLGIPTALLVAHGVAAPPGPHRDADLPWPAPLLPAFMGAYTGALTHRFFPRLMSSSWFGRQLPW